MRTGSHEIALVIHSDQIQFGAAPIQFGAFLPQQLHAMTLEQSLSGKFRSGIDLVIAITSPGAQRRTQAAEFADAVFQRIALAAYKIAGDDGEVRFEIVRHFNRATNLLPRHELSDMQVA